MIPTLTLPSLLVGFSTTNFTRASEPTLSCNQYHSFSIMYAAELETLDQLLGSDMPLTAVAKLYSSPEAFRMGIGGLLSCGDVLLLDTNGNAVPSWRWREVFEASSDAEQLGQFQLRVTPQGAKRVS
jgi:hypothetical protein